MTTLSQSTLEKILIEKILIHLNFDERPPASVEGLSQLLWRYVRTVSWGSVFRINRFATLPTPEARVRNPEQFWLDAIERGGDGTCFESNWAFYALLCALGFECELTLNDMQEQPPECHSAIVCNLQGRRYLVDVGLPLFAPIEILPQQQSKAQSLFFKYTLHPIAPDEYEVVRHPHARPQCFLFRDRAVQLERYEARTQGDYEPDGYFLDAVIIHKVINNTIWRFNGRESLRQVECFSSNHEKKIIPITKPLAPVLSEMFKMDLHTLKVALYEAHLHGNI
ncbi:MAG: arylamine N-acetyltransferase [Phototrophicaceae bacterium]